MYGGIEEVEIDCEHNFYYVHRDSGTWNRYHIDSEQPFLQWVYDHRHDFEVYRLDNEDMSDDELWEEMLG